jgi:hypothetical protein
MREFLFRCPNSGLTVQGIAPDEAFDPREEFWIEIECHICGRTHAVDPPSGEVQNEAYDHVRRSLIPP